MLGLSTFADGRQEAHFSAFYGIQYRGTYLLHTGLMICIWLIRGYHFYLDPAILQRDILVTLALAAVGLHSLNLWKICRNPNYCSELRKALTFVGDLALCMFAVLLSGQLTPVPFTSCAVVHSVHGWGSVAGGFRSHAQLLLQLLNLECYILMASQNIGGAGVSGFLKIVASAMGLVLINSMVPILINFTYEARQRAQYVKKFGLKERVPPVWSSILS